MLLGRIFYYLLITPFFNFDYYIFFFSLTFLTYLYSGVGQPDQAAQEGGHQGEQSRRRGRCLQVSYTVNAFIYGRIFKEFNIYVFLIYIV